MADNGTVIDRLVVQLGLDPEQLTKGQRQAVESIKRTAEEATKAGSRMEQDGKKAAEFFGQVKKEALGLFAVVVGAGGIAEFTSKTVTGLNAVGRSAELAGVKVREFVAYQNLIARQGGDPAAAGAALQQMASRIAEWKRTGVPDTNLLQAFNRIGANPNESPVQIIEQFADWAAKNKRNPQLVNSIGGLLGLDQASIALGLRGGGAVRAGMAESYRLGVPSQEDIDKTNRALGEFRTLLQRLNADMREMLVDVAPGLTAVTTAADDLAGANKTMTKIVLAGVGALTGFFSLKWAAGLLRLLGIKLPSVVLDAAAGGAVRGAAKVAGIAASGPLDVVAGVIWPSKMGDGTLTGEGKPLGGGPARGALAGGHAGVARWLTAALAGESYGGDPNAYTSAGGGMGAYGVGQWRGARLRRLRDFAAARGKPINDLATQYAFMAWEFTHDPQGIAAARKIDAAVGDEAKAQAFIRYFEAPGAQGLEHDFAATHRYLTTGHLPGGQRSEISIGEIKVIVGKGDPDAIAKGIGGALRHNLPRQANTGLTG